LVGLCCFWFFFGVSCGCFLLVCIVFGVALLMVGVGAQLQSKSKRCFVCVFLCASNFFGLLCVFLLPLFAPAANNKSKQNNGKGGFAWPAPCCWPPAAGVRHTH
jgi:hypothetical protein